MSCTLFGVHAWFLQGLLERAGGHMTNVTPASATDSGELGGGTRQGLGNAGCLCLHPLAVW